jgi:N-acyl amino acid synthase of PEP-CTERM/exosortase system
VERNFERAEDHPGEIERDAFDDVALHFLCEAPDGSPVGTLRLIPPSPLGYPLEQHCTLTIDPGQLPRDRLAEISRLAITREYQRRRSDPFHPGPVVVVDRRSGEPDRRASPLERRRLAGDRRRRDVATGLYREMFRASKQLRITQWYAAMQDKLLILLQGFGFVFQQVGPFIEYHGRRAPFLASVSACEEGLRNRFPEIYQDYTAGL